MFEGCSTGTYGPLYTYYDISVQTVEEIVGIILAITAMVTAASTSGLSIAVFKQGISTLCTYGGSAQYLQSRVPNASINGYFKYTQEVDLTNYRARNINRQFAIRTGSSDNYYTYSYGNGGWFDTIRP